MSGVEEAVSNGACSDLQPINGTGHSSNVSAVDTASCRISSNGENSSTHYAASSLTDENAVSVSVKQKCAVCHNVSAEASNAAISHSDASSEADSVAIHLRAASQNCNSETRTSRVLYSDTDGYFVNITHENTTTSASNVTASLASKSVCGGYLSTTNGVDVRSGSPHNSSVNASVHSDDPVDHNSASDGASRCLASEQISSGVEASSSSSAANTDLTETLTSMLANADLCDDGYMDDIDIVSLSTVLEPERGQTAAWFVETDAGLDDFIDADMPHNAAVAGSPSSSSLSSTLEESGGIPHNGSGNLMDIGTANVSESDATVNLEQQSWHNLQLNLCTEECEAMASSYRGLDHSDQGSAISVCSSQTQPSHSSVRCLESVVVYATHRVNKQSSNPTVGSSHGAPLASLPSPSDEYYSTSNSIQKAAEAVADRHHAISIPVAAEFLIGAAEEQVFEVNTLVGSSSRETHDRQSADAKQNRCYPLSVGPSDSDQPAFGCSSCVSMMNYASLGLPHWLPPWYAMASRRRFCEDGVMWRSATGDYVFYDRSHPLTDDSQQSSPRMSSSLTFEDLRDDGLRDRSTCRGRHSSRPAAATSVSSRAPRCYSTKDVYWEPECDMLTAEYLSGLEPLRCQSVDSVIASSCSTVAVVNVLAPVSGTSQLVPETGQSVILSGAKACSISCWKPALKKRLGITGRQREVGSLMHRTPCSDNKLQLCEFLLTQSRAGTSVDEITEGLAAFTAEKVFGKFFHQQLLSNIRLSKWLDSWIKIGAVPLATLKIIDQTYDRNQTTESWQHLLVHDVRSEGIVVGDLPCIVTEDELVRRLSCEPTVVVRRADVMSRWRDSCDLSVLIYGCDEDWHSINVIGQVLNMLREERMAKCSNAYRPYLTSHITVPSRHRPGISLFVTAQSPAYDRLQHSLPTDLID